MKDITPIVVDFNRIKISALPSLLPIRKFGRYYGFRKDLTKALENLPKGEALTIPFAPKREEEVASMLHAIRNSFPVAQRRTGMAWKVSYNDEKKFFLVGRREEWENIMGYGGDRNNGKA